MNQRYAAKLVTQEPASLGVESEIAFRRDAYRYIPGMVLRGALAALWIGEFGTPDKAERDRFIHLFEVALRPGRLLPEGLSVRPLSVARCKYHVGSGDPLEWDNAIPGDQAPCAACGTSVEYGRGEIVFPPGDDPLMTTTHVAHENGVAKSGALYARRYIKPGTSFTGELFGPSDSFLETFKDGRDIWLGGRRTVAGRATLTLTPEPPRVTASAIPEGTEFVLRLRAPAIFVDDIGRPSEELPLADLARALGVRPGQVRLLHRPWTRTTVVRGWHAATRLPKPADRAMVQGSTWRLAVDAQVSAERVIQLCQDGLGLRRAEGFGLVEVLIPPTPSTKSTEPEGKEQPAVEPKPEPPRTDPADQALMRASDIWHRVAADPRARRAVLELLRDTTGKAPGTWSDVFQKPTRPVRLLQTVSADKGLRTLFAVGDVGLVRDVRLVLDGWTRGDGLRWLMPTTGEKADV